MLKACHDDFGKICIPKRKLGKEKRDRETERERGRVGGGQAERPFMDNRKRQREGEGDIFERNKWRQIIRRQRKIEKYLLRLSVYLNLEL